MAKKTTEQKLKFYNSLLHAMNIKKIVKCNYYSSGAIFQCDLMGTIRANIILQCDNKFPVRVYTRDLGGSSLVYKDIMTALNNDYKIYKTKLMNKENIEY